MNINPSFQQYFSDFEIARAQSLPECEKETTSFSEIKYFGMHQFLGSADFEVCLEEYSSLLDRLIDFAKDKVSQIVSELPADQITSIEIAFSKFKEHILDVERDFFESDKSAVYGSGKDLFHELEYLLRNEWLPAQDRLNVIRSMAPHLSADWSAVSHALQDAISTLKSEKTTPDDVYPVADGSAGTFRNATQEFNDPVATRNCTFRACISALMAVDSSGGVNGPLHAQSVDPAIFLIAAAATGHVEELEASIASGANVNALFSKAHKNALIEAVASGADSHGKLSSLGVFFRRNHLPGRSSPRRGAEANASHGVTPLMIASEFGHVQAVKALINAGADTRMSDHMGRTAETFAARHPDGKLLEVLHRAERRARRPAANPGRSTRAIHAAEAVRP